MKKHLLFAFIACLCISFTSKAQSIAARGDMPHNKKNLADNNVIGFHPTASSKPFANTNRAVTKTKIGSSYNGLTLLVSESNCLTANQSTNTIMFTHRINYTWPAPLVNSGFIQSTFSFNGGITWDSLLHMEEQNPILCRYPSGAIFNPVANIIPGNAFSVVSGPITNGLTPAGWKGNYFASTQLNKTNPNKNIRLNATSGVVKQHFARIGMQSTDNKVIVTGGLYGGEPDGATLADQKYRGATINYGTPSGSSFTWTIDSIKPNFKYNTLESSNYANTIAQTAWSQDGMTGYVIFSGIDNSATGANLTYQPLVWKTVNGGTNWNQLPLFNFANIPAINAKTLFTTDGTLQKAFYTQNNGFDAIVDYQGNLHIVNSLLSGYQTHPDSLGYIYKPEVVNNNITYIFDTYYNTTSGTWNAQLIDSLKCIPAEANSPFQDTDGTKFPIDARIQISKSTDGTHLFYIWGDSDPGDASGENALPDIYGRGWNLTTNLLTPTTKFTNDAINYYLFVSNVALVNGITYTIPATVSLCTDPNYNIDNPFDHYYLSGIQFTETDFTIGINEIVQNGDLSISQNYPNPFSRSTSIDVTLKSADNVSLEIYNTIGQNVMSQNSGKLGVGTHTFTIDGSKLTAGIYFYTIKTDNATITRKMIVQ